ncbi:MAG: hypothetical protein M1835_008147 [Candelina submexicana]|nr:MAG: hypothetical protein M1835_008147 [Candelina submexicana]
MSLPPLDLGQLHLQYIHSDYKLRVVSSIQTSSINNTDVSPPDLDLRDALTSREVWATRGDGLQLAIKILINCNHLEGTTQRTQLIEGLGTVLQEAEVSSILCPLSLWKQLHLRSSLSLPSLHEDPHSATPDIVLRLHNAEYPGKVETVPKRRLAHASTPIADVRPPLGVPRVGLETINITFDFFLDQAKKREPNRKKLKTVDLERLQDLFPATKDKADEDVLLLDEEYFSQSVIPTGPMAGLDFEVLEQERRRASQPTRSSNHLFSLLDDDIEGCQAPAFNEHYPSSRPSIQADVSHAHTLKRPAEGQLSAAQRTDALHLQHAVHLTDAALRNLICNRPLRTAPGIKVKRNLTARLADLAPVLWSPGYLPAIAQRAHFIPTIAQAMASISTRAHSSTLRDKLMTISALAPSPILKTPRSEISVTGSSSVDRQAISTVLKARFWRIMQQKLFDPSAAKRLSPLKVSETAETQSAFGKYDTEEMLVEDVTESQDAFTQLADEEMLEEELMNGLETTNDRSLDAESLSNPFSSSNPHEASFESLFDEGNDILFEEYDDFDEDFVDLNEDIIHSWNGFDGSLKNETRDSDEMELSRQLDSHMLYGDQTQQGSKASARCEVPDNEVLAFSNIGDSDLLQEEEEELGISSPGQNAWNGEIMLI